MAQRGSDWLAPMLFKASCTHLTVTTWIEKMLLPALQSNSLVIMGNAPFHNKPKISQILAAAGHTPLFTRFQPNRAGVLQSSSGNVNSQAGKPGSLYRATLKWNDYICR
jgi:hypothetical protein